MQKRNLKSLVIVAGSVLILGIVTYAFADRGWGHRGSGWHHDGYGHHGMYNDGDYQALTDKELESLREERETFRKAAKEMQEQVYEKELALKAELAKKSPDTEKAAKIQSEISGLQGQLDQKRLEHQIAVKKINPDAGKRLSDRGPKSYGRRGYCR